MSGVCRSCGTFIEPRKCMCTRCGEWTASETGGIGSVSKAKTTTLDQVTPHAVERIVTGGPWDPAWGGGIVPTSITLMGGGPGLGKALALDTPIPTPSGWTTMEKIQADDLVLDDHGEPTRVYACSDVMLNHKCYAVYFENPERRGLDSSSCIVADADHLWATRTYQEGEPQVRTTRQLFDEYYRLRHTIHCREPGRPPRWVVHAILPVPSVPVRCIAVESKSKLYLAGRQRIPTHNTTMLLQIASMVATLTSKRTYFLSAEQVPAEIRMTANRLGILNTDRIRVLSDFGSGAEVDEELLKEDPPGMFILDSISALVGKDSHAALKITKTYKQYAVKHHAPSVLICHMTKEHDYAGLMALQHEVDTLMTLFANDEGMRELKAWKNRYGATFAEYPLLMTEHGLVAPPPKPEKKKKFIGLPLETPLPEAPKAEAPVPPTRFKSPNVIDLDGQRLVRRKKEPDRARAIEGEALKKPRAPMPKEPLKASLSEVVKSKLKVKEVKGRRGEPETRAKRAEPAAKKKKKEARP